MEITLFQSGTKFPLGDQISCQHLQMKIVLEYGAHHSLIKLAVFKCEFFILENFFWIFSNKKEKKEKRKKKNVVPSFYVDRLGWLGRRVGAGGRPCVGARGPTQGVGADSVGWGQGVCKSQFRLRRRADGRLR
jgi:hypothetical protein